MPLLIAVVVIGGLAAAGVELPKLPPHKTPTLAGAAPSQNTPPARNVACQATTGT
jgi:hypothetical protein